MAKKGSPKDKGQRRAIAHIKDKKPYNKGNGGKKKTPYNRNNQNWED